MVKRCLYITLLPLLFFSCKGTWSKVTISSMEPNVKVGSAIQIVEGQTYTYGDIVVIEGLADFWEIYRIVALPGDSIAIEDFLCVVNGQEYKGEYLNKEIDPDGNEVSVWREYWKDGKKLTLWIGRELKECPSHTDAIMVPENHYYVLGDYRTDALDSRSVGSVPIEKIKGKVVRNWN